MELRLSGWREGRSADISPENCVNLFYEKTENGDALINTHGSKQLSNPATGVVRGAIEYNDNAFFVIRNTLYEVTKTGLATSRGTLNTNVGRVSMAHNGTRSGANQQLFIADSTQRYIYDNTTQTLTGYTDYAAVTVVFLDGYFVFNVADTDRFYITSLYDGTTVGADDFATAEGDPDELVAVAADGRDLLLFGKKTLEVWYNAGDPDNTFQRYQGGHAETGLGAAFSVQQFDNSIAWMTRNKRGARMVAIMGEGYRPRIISTPEVNYRLSTYTNYEDAFAYTYQHEGHEFYCLTFPSHKATEVYDASTKKWHRRGHTIEGVFPNRERYNCHAFAFGEHLFGDVSNGKIYQLDASLGTIAGERIPRELVLPNITDEERRIRIKAFQLDMEEGTGDPNVATDTTVWLSYAKDGGHHYSNELDKTMGDAGEYRSRVIWRRLGWARNWTFKIRTWSPNRVIMKGVYIHEYGA